MKNFKLLFLSLFLLIYFNSSGQNAGVTSIGSAISCPNTIILIPVYVLHSPSISAINLSVIYDSSVLSALQIGNNRISFLNVNLTLIGGVLGAQSNNILSPATKRLNFGWGSGSGNGMYLDSNTTGLAKICDIPFRYLGGNTSLIFDNSNYGGHYCEYSDSNSNDLIDTPTIHFYINGTVSQLPPPLIQGNITGNLFPCVGSNSQYSVVGSSGVTFVWSGPGTWIGQSDSSTINFLVGTFTNDSIIVAPVNVCGDTGSSVSLIINENTVPVFSGPITSTDSTPCISTFQTFSVMNIPGATYTWSAPSSWIGSSSSNSITYQVGSFSYDTVFVSASNICGSSPPLSILVHDCSLEISNNLITNDFSVKNFPNPFINNTTIEFSIPEQGFVSIEIFNILGEHLINVPNFYLPEGKHDFNVNLENFTNGVFFYKVKYLFNGQVQSKTGLMHKIKP